MSRPYLTSRTFFLDSTPAGGSFAAWGIDGEYAMRRHSDFCQPGMWNVSAYPRNTEVQDWLPRSNQYKAPAVIDDFGNLVRVPDAEAIHV